MTSGGSAPAEEDKSPPSGSAPSLPTRTVPTASSDGDLPPDAAGGELAPEETEPGRLGILGLRAGEAAVAGLLFRRANGSEHDTASTIRATRNRVLPCASPATYPQRPRQPPLWPHQRCPTVPTAAAAAQYQSPKYAKNRPLKDRTDPSSVLRPLIFIRPKLARGRLGTTARRRGAKAMATCSPSTAIDALATLTLKEEGREGAPALTSGVVQSGEAVVQLWRLVMGMVEEDTVMPSAEQLVQILQPSEAHDRTNFQVGYICACASCPHF